MADFDHDGWSNTSHTWPPYQALGFFVSSVDVFAPANSRPVGEVTVGLESRGKGPLRTVSFPNFPGTTDDVTVQFNDYEPAPPVTCTARQRHRQRSAGCRASTRARHVAAR